MPTVTEPKSNEEIKSQPSTPPPAEPELFAAELAMEKRSYNFLPLLLAVALLLLIGGSIYYFVRSAHEVLSTSEATGTINEILRGQGPAVTRFSTGTVDPNNGQKDPQYKLLSKAGIVLSKPKGTTTLIVAVTGPGESVLSAIDGVQRVKNKHGGDDYAVPLAQRQLLSIDKITLLRPHLAKVDYTWKWAPNRLGQEYDASGPLVKSFTTWERSTLINSYAVDFYSAAPSKTSIILLKANDGPWAPYRE